MVRFVNLLVCFTFGLFATAAAEPIVALAPAGEHAAIFPPPIVSLHLSSARSGRPRTADDLLRKPVKFSA